MSFYPEVMHVGPLALSLGSQHFYLVVSIIPEYLEQPSCLMSLFTIVFQGTSFNAPIFLASNLLSIDSLGSLSSSSSRLEHFIYGTCSHSSLESNGY